MLKPMRLTYFAITILVVLLGIASRKIDTIPLFIGDILYAVMVYFGCRLLSIHANKTSKIFLPLIICFLIELQQLYDAEWVVTIRNTTLGHYILGQGFLWSDLLCYTVGIVLAFSIDRRAFKEC